MNSDFDTNILMSTFGFSFIKKKMTWNMIFMDVLQENHENMNYNSIKKRNVLFKLHRYVPTCIIRDPKFTKI